MSKVCDICHKGPTTGHNVSHSKRHTKRTWHPNLITKRMMINGHMQTLRICAKCLKTLSKAPRKKPTRTVVSATGKPKPKS
ncbi:50S ribosomal protein L28 [candidate division Kazan bacterium]|uniref:Large ribosomal subunit protein bL28 n=1 Tax=candidate division Kazan bacterium TaxID=2202143 RepID=A0A420ZCW7_UNCK3|nr:MAG: 50S ribosomal protein L28 [candidate division Kazan bacterium]